MMGEEGGGGGREKDVNMNHEAVTKEPESEGGVTIAGDETSEQLKRNEQLALLRTRFQHRISQQAIYRGLLLNKTTTPQGLDAVRNGSLRPEDCLVCGYPKSGTTWLEEVVYLIQHKGDFTAAKSQPCYIRVPLWEDARMTKVISNMAYPRTLKSHLPYDLLPASCENNKIVCIVRNPKDVAVSYFYFYQSLTELNNYSGTWAEFVQMFMDGFVVYMDWFSHVTSWWQQRERHNILLVTYEHMKAQPECAVREIAHFFHGSSDALAPDTVKAIVEHTSFSAMKENPSTNFAHIETIRLPFMRKGKVGDWKDHFTVAQNDAFDELIRQRITDPQLLRLIQQNTG